jgi:transposase-like protein
MLEEAMGLILSQAEKDQFIEGLKYARGEGGWSDVDIARTLSVSNGDFKNMLTGHKPPSQKHVDRLNNLMHSSPPRRVTPPPPPSKPIINLPDLTTQKPARPDAKVLYIGDDGGAPRNGAAHAAAGPARAEEPPKEGTDMTTTEAVNGMSNGAKHRAVKKTREAGPPTAPKKKLRRGTRASLSKADQAELRRQVKELVKEADGNMSLVARGMGVDRNTIANIINGDGGSEETREKFRQYRAKLKGTVSEARAAAAPRRKLLDEYGPSAPHDEPQTDGIIDLYNMAGRLLSAGRVPEAHLLSLVARITETSAVEKVTAVLRRLLPNAANG